MDHFLSCYVVYQLFSFFFFFQAEDGIRDHCVTGVQTCALPIYYREPLPVAAMNKDHDRLFITDGKQVDCVPYPWAVSNSPRNVALAIICRVLSPAGNDRGVFRNARPDRKSVV